MSDDCLRTELAFKLLCSKCGEALAADHRKSKFEAGSAYKSEAVFSIHPCRKCMENARKPVSPYA